MFTFWPCDQSPASEKLSSFSPSIVDPHLTVPGAQEDRAAKSPPNATEEKAGGQISPGCNAWHGMAGLHMPGPRKKNEDLPIGLPSLVHVRAATIDRSAALGSHNFFFSLVAECFCTNTKSQSLEATLGNLQRCTCACISDGW